MCGSETLRKEHNLASFGIAACLTMTMKCFELLWYSAGKRQTVLAYYVDAMRSPTEAGEASIANQAWCQPFGEGFSSRHEISP